MASAGLELSRPSLADPVRAAGNPQPDQADRRRIEEMPAADRSAEPGPARKPTDPCAERPEAGFQDLEHLIQTTGRSAARRPKLLHCVAAGGVGENGGGAG